MNKENNGFTEKIISIDRVSRTVKGGKRMRFRVLVVIGDKKGSVGMGLGKANEVALAVNKATNQARKHLIKVNIVNETISHEITTR
ncbi:MAG: 30S ribosomal protein S5, partial [Patescibacteria group bacterium]|nr:30S ribosomal protein S5 [Patescibacteria group bacterium]